MNVLVYCVDIFGVFGDELLNVVERMLVFVDGEVVLVFVGVGDGVWMMVLVVVGVGVGDGVWMILVIGVGIVVVMGIGVFIVVCDDGMMMGWSSGGSDGDDVVVLMWLVRLVLILCITSVNGLDVIIY